MSQARESLGNAGEQGAGERRPLSISARGMVFSGWASGPETGQPVLLLHGFPQFAESWFGVMDRLTTAGYRVVAIDQRGYSVGARPAEIEAYRSQELVADVIGVADALGWGRFHLAGHDWGGFVAWAVAAAHGDRVLSVSVVSTPHPEAFRTALRTSVRQMWMSKYMLLFRAPGHLAERAFLAREAEGLRRVFAGKVDPAEVEETVRRMRAGALTPALNWYRAMRMETRVGVVCRPALYVWGDRDVALGETAALTTATWMTGPYRFKRVRGGTHWLLGSHAEDIAGWMVETMRE